MEKQDPAYRHGGVPLDRGTRDLYDAVWGPNVLPHVIPDPVTCYTDDNSPTFDDASDAINGLIGRGDLAPIGQKGYQWFHSGDVSFHSPSLFLGAKLTDCTLSLFWQTSSLIINKTGIQVAKSPTTRWRQLRS